MARLQNKKQAAVTTGGPRHAGLPCAMVLAAYTWSPRGPAWLPPSSATRQAHHRQLGISTGMPGPHDFTGASDTFVRMSW